MLVRFFIAFVIVTLQMYKIFKAVRHFFKNSRCNVQEIFLIVSRLRKAVQQSLCFMSFN